MNATARLTTLTRLGFAARGLLYLVIAYLILRTGRAEDPSGALGVVAEGAGKWLLVLMTAGFVSYGLWRLSDAAFNIERHEDGRRGLGERLGAAASGVVHLFLAWQSVRLIQGSAESSAGSSGAQEGAATALHLPGGQLMLLIAGLVLIVTGLLQFVSAYRLRFCKNLDPRIAGQPWVRWAGWGGFTARGLVFLISGFFLAQAGLKEQASEAGGMAEALNWLNSPWDTLVAIGLALFGIFSLIEARYRIIHDVPVEGMARQARSKLPI